MSVVRTELKDGILSIVMSRIDKKNAINADMYLGLKEAIEFADKNKDVKVMLISGDGGCFTSGNDLFDFLNFKDDIKTNPALQFIHTIKNAEKPIVAAVSGLAIGIGVTMLLHCDIVVVSKDAIFQMPFVNLGLCPEAGSTVILPQLVGYQNAAKLTLLAETFTAEDALKLGLASYVVEPEELLPFSNEIAKKISLKSEKAVLTTKRLLKNSFKTLLDTLIDEESKTFLELLKTKEVRDNINNFLNKKK